MNDDELLRRISLYSPSVTRELTQYRFKTYGQYMAHIMSGNRRFHGEESPSRLEARSILFAEISDRFGDGPVHQLKSAPAIQTGNHNQLLIDRLTFNSYVSQIVGLAELELNYLIAFSASAVSLTTSGRDGPAWVEGASGSFPVIDAGRRYIDKGAVISPVPVSLLREESFWSQPSPIIRRLDSFIEWNEKGRFADIVTSANSKAIAAMTNESKIIPCIFDERLVAMMLLRHLQGGTIVSKLLINQDIHNFIISYIRSDHGELGRLLMPASPMLWYIDKHKLRPVALVGDTLLSNGGNWSSPLKIDALVEHVSSGAIIPGPFLTLCMIGLLPGISLIGGPRQIAYLPVFSRIFDQAMRRLGGPRLYGSENFLNSWGMRVDDCGLQPADISFSCNDASTLDEIAKERSGLRLLDITSNFRLFRNHSFWRKALQIE